MFISAVDMTIVNVALPAISKDLGAGVGELQWVLDAFLVALAGLLLVGSGLADRFGRRRIFLGGMAAFGIASILCALAPSPIALIAARALMGAAAACVLPPALSLLAVMFPPEERPKALGVWASVAGLGLVAGPLLGGVLVELIGWEMVFLVNVPVSVVVVPYGLKVLPESTRPGTPPLDLLGAAISIVALTGIVFALIEGSDRGWTSPEVLASAVIGLAAGAVFFRVELSGRPALFDVRVLARLPVAAGGIAILSVYIAFLGSMFLLPQYLQYVQDRSVMAAGLALAPLGLGCAIGARYNASLLAKFGPRLTIGGGLVAMAAVTALYLLLGRDTTIAVPLVAALLIGIVVAIVVAPATAVIMNDLGEAKAGDGGAVNQLARQVGGALGVALVGTVFAVAYANQVDAKLASLSEPQRERASESIEEARQVIAGTSESDREGLTARADDAFDDAARAGFVVCIAVLLLAALFTAVALAPRRLLTDVQMPRPDGPAA